MKLKRCKFVVISIYRITIHPLAKYPGPLLQRISDWPLVVHCYKGDRHLWEYRNHVKYGKHFPDHYDENFYGSTKTITDKARSFAMVQTAFRSAHPAHSKPSTAQKPTSKKEPGIRLSTSQPALPACKWRSTSTSML